MKLRVSYRQLRRAIVQGGSLRLPIAAARVRARARSCGICGQSGTGAGFLRVLRFPLPIIASIAPHSSGAGTIGQMVADVPSGHSLTPPQENTRKLLASSGSTGSQRERMSNSQTA
jgi:hypothetical protein